MNKLVLAICLLTLVLTGANTLLLVQMGGQLKETGDKMKAATKSLETVQPLLQGLEEKKGAIPNDKPPLPLPKP